jgi:hypothetical protein
MILAQGGRGGPPPTAKASAPIDLTGYWTAGITEDWHVRMLTPEGGGRGRIPYKAQAAKSAPKWDPAKDEAEGNQCKAYGAPGIMRQPTHLHISWQDDNTLKVEADFGTQTRLFHFPPPPRGGRIDFVSGAYVPPELPKMEPPAGLEASWQGFSVAMWNAMGGDSSRAAGLVTPSSSERLSVERGGDLQVVTTHLKPGYYWRNGVPYSGNAVLTEHYRVIDIPESSPWIILVQIVEDPDYLSQPFVVSYQFKKLPDGSKWNPVPCSVK